MPDTRTVQLRPDLTVTLAEAGTGRIALILHGGGGPATFARRSRGGDQGHLRRRSTHLRRRPLVKPSERLERPGEKQFHH